MGRTILDGELRRWEAFATTGEYGFPDDSRVVFRCLSDPEVRARAYTVEGDKSDAEEAVSRASPDELTRMLGESTEID